MRSLSLKPKYTYQTSDKKEFDNRTKLYNDSLALYNSSNRLRKIYNSVGDEDMAAADKYNASMKIEQQKTANAYRELTKVNGVKPQPIRTNWKYIDDHRFAVSGPTRIAINTFKEPTTAIEFIKPVPVVAPKPQLILQPKVIEQPKQVDEGIWRFSTGTPATKEQMDSIDKYNNAPTTKKKVTLTPNKK